jgi:hypothetical protein
MYFCYITEVSAILMLLCFKPTRVDESEGETERKREQFITFVLQRDVAHICSFISYSDSSFAMLQFAPNIAQHYLLNADPALPNITNVLTNCPRLARFYGPKKHSDTPHVDWQTLHITGVGLLLL